MVTVYRDHLNIVDRLHVPLSVMEGFTIRFITTKTEFENIVIKAMVKEQWRPGLHDTECYVACDEITTLVGELDGKPIGCVILTKYGDSFGVIGGNIVCEEYRGKGYGRKIFDAALVNLKRSRNIALLAGPHHEKMYEKSGFRGHFNVARFNFHLPTTLNCFPEISENPPVEIRGVDQSDGKALLAYDSGVFGFHRHAFLMKWLRAHGSHARVAIDEEGSVVGYVVARAMFVKDHGYKIGPLFADYESIAVKLLKAVFKELLQQNDPPPAVCIDALGQNAIKLAEKLRAKIDKTAIYMTTNGLPNACFDKWFGMTDFNLG